MQTQLWISGQAKTRELAAYHFIPVTNQKQALRPKPHGGLWTTDWDEENQSSPWIRFCIDEQFANIYQTTWWLLKPDPKARIYVINDLTDLNNIVRRFHIKGYGQEIQIDFEKAAKHYDGIFLTEQGQQKTKNTIPNLKGWDFACTLWFHWKFNAIHKIFDPMNQFQIEL